MQTNRTWRSDFKAPLKELRAPLVTRARVCVTIRPTAGPKYSHVMVTVAHGDEDRGYPDTATMVLDGTTSINESDIVELGGLVAGVLAAAAERIREARK